MTEIRQLIAGSAFSDLDRHFAAFIEGQAGGEQPLVALAAALVSHKRGDGHICLDLEGMAGSTFPDLPPDDVAPIPLPRLKDWTKALTPSPVVGSPGEFKPLVLDARHRLYLHRYWEYEQTLAAAILKRAADVPPQPDPPTLHQKLQVLFPRNRARPSTGNQLLPLRPCAASSASSPAAPARARPTRWC